MIVIELLVDPEFHASPEYVAVKVCTPIDKAVVVRFHGLTVWLAAPKEIGPSKNVAVPVGVGANPPVAWNTCSHSGTWFLA